MASQETIIPKDPRRRFGNRGEDAADAFLVSQGFCIIERNWSCRLGEIDIICKKDNVIHFVEVKTRRGRKFGYPEEAITPAKLRHLHHAVQAYLERCPSPPMEYQIDALAITLFPDVMPEFHYIENIA